MLFVYRFERKLIIAFLLSLCGIPLHAQNIADTLELHEIQVKATRISEPPEYQPVYVTLIDSSRLRFYDTGNLADVLSAQSPAFVRDYGPGGEATVSIRGFDATHTQVIWEGMNLNHPMLGLTDLSMIPVYMLSSIQLAAGNPSTAFGSGSSGGTIYLSSDMNTGNSVRTAISAGSYGQNRQSVMGGFHSGPWSFDLLTGRSGSKNDFKYYNSLSGRTEKRLHNGEQGRQLMINSGWKGGNLTIRSGLWYNHVENDIAQSITQNDYTGHQHDQSTRWYLHLKTDGGITRYSVRTYYSFYNLRYIDPQVKVDSRSHSLTMGAETQLTHYFSKTLRFDGGLLLRHDIIHTNNYAAGARRWSGTAYMRGEYNPVSPLRVYPSLRFDSYSDFGSRMSPSLGINYALKDDVLYARADLKRDFTIPTFNELYWAVGGNPNLKAEESFTAETGITYQPVLGTNVALNISPGLYRTTQQNGIRWIPQSNGTSIPVNILGLRMIGLEMASGLIVHTGNWNIEAHNTSDWTQAQVVKDQQNNVNVLGKQIIYVPEWTSKSRLSISRGIFEYYIDNQWVGARYTTSDHSSPLDPLHAYSIWDSGVRIRYETGPFTAALSGTCRNVFNQSYQVIAWYPMPGRNFMTELSLTILF